MHRVFILALRASVVVAFMASLFGQIVVIPQTAADEVNLVPAYAPFAAPYVAMAILGVACVQVALVAVWMLLSMVRQSAIFTPRAFRWVDTIIGASIVATLLAAGVAVHLFVAEIPAPPSHGMQVVGAFGAAIVSVGVGTSFAMLVAVLRSLLGKATDLQAEMAAVV